MTTAEEKVIKALELDWQPDWIISVTENKQIKAISFSVHIETDYVKCNQVKITEIEVYGNWLHLVGWFCYY